eukprot:TRINITY_DN12917_c0_g1_i1.p1 TRINITY_DN12917_c0_g1~~TRINITY_DN12917_c0_g1_i1.p1  ORF type:complete len:258 (-),score=36.86 TRINITY_DN12917_c0_g1_i1:26-799(-)
MKTGSANQGKVIFALLKQSVHVWVWGNSENIDEEPIRKGIINLPPATKELRDIATCAAISHNGNILYASAGAPLYPWHLCSKTWLRMIKKKVYVVQENTNVISSLTIHHSDINVIGLGLVNGNIGVANQINSKYTMATKLHNKKIIELSFMDNQSTDNNSTILLSMCIEGFFGKWKVVNYSSLNTEQIAIELLAHYSFKGENFGFCLRSTEAFIFSGAQLFRFDCVAMKIIENKTVHQLVKAITCSVISLKNFHNNF